MGCVSANEDITYLICHVTSQDDVIKESSDFMGERPLWQLTTLRRWMVQ